MSRRRRALFWYGGYTNIAQPPWNYANGILFSIGWGIEAPERHALNGCSGQRPSPETFMPIATFAMSCRFPGDASSVKGLWEMCCSRKSVSPKTQLTGQITGILILPNMVV